MAMTNECTAQHHNNVNVFVADNDPALRAGFQLMLEHQPGFCAVGSTVPSALPRGLSSASHVDMLLLDWDDAEVRGGLLARLKEQFPGLAIVATSTRPERETEARQAAADAFVSKADSPALLVAALNEVASVIHVRRLAVRKPPPWSAGTRGIQMTNEVVAARQASQGGKPEPPPSH